MFSKIQQNAIIKYVKAFNQLWNKLSFHTTQELNHKTIWVAVHNKTHLLLWKVLGIKFLEQGFKYWHF